MNQRKTLGVIGGMGPLATCDFLRGIVEHTVASHDQEHLDVLVYSHASLPGRTEAIATGNVSVLREMLIEDARMLERNGAGILAIPCNTSHVFYDDIQAAVNVPVIHMVREAMRSLRRVKSVGILATEGTVSSDTYGREGASLDIRTIYPEPDIQRRVTDIIDRVKSGGRPDAWDLRVVAEDLVQRGCDRVILACTELSCTAHNVPREGVVPREGTSPGEPIFVDAMEVLIRECIVLCGGKYR